MKLRRFWAVLCCLSLVAVLLVPVSFAADDWNYELQTEFFDFYDSDSGLAYKIVQNSKNEVMVGAYFERGTNANGNTSYRYRYSGEKTIPAMVTNDNTEYTVVGIDQIAFQNTAVTAVNMPAESPAFQTIGAYAFRSCKSLKSIVIPASVTMLGTRDLDGSVFEGAALESVTFAKDSALECIGKFTFSGCTSLSELTLPDSVTYIGGAAFASCKSLSSVTIPAKAKLDAGVFGGAANVDPYYDGAANDGKGNIFFAAGSEYQIKDGILYDRDSLLTVLELRENVAIPEGIKFIHNEAFKMFGGDDTLKSVTFPSTLESIGVDAFNGNTGLTSITIPASVTSLGANAFMNCTKLASIEIKAKLTEIPDYGFGGTAISSIALPDTIEKIGASAFARCKSLASVKIPDSVTKIGDSAFIDCAALAAVELPAHLTSIEKWAFKGCTQLRALQIPETVTKIGAGAFTNCRALESIAVPDGITAIEKQAFANCSALKTLILPSSIKTVGSQALQGALAADHVLVMQGGTPPVFDPNVFGKGGKPAVNILIPTTAKAAYTDSSFLLKDDVKDNGLYGLTMNDRSMKAVAAGGTGDTLTFTADVPAGATLTVESSNPGIATAVVNDDGKTVTVTSAAQGEAKITAKITLDNSNFVLLENTAAVTVLAADKEPAVIVPAEPETKTDVPSGTDMNLISKVETALKPSGDGSGGLTVGESELASAAHGVATQNTVSAEDGKTALKTAQIPVKETDKITIVVQSYLDVTIKSVTAEGDAASLTLDITPMYQKVATTADLDKASPDDIVVQKEGAESPNAVVVGSGTLTIAEPVEVKVPLPEGFTEATRLFVTHTKGNGRSYVYTGSVADSILTFTNPNGFSTFVMSAADPAAAKIGDIGYVSLQDALDDADTGSTVSVWTDGLTGGITETKTITLRNTADSPITVTINGTAYRVAAGGTREVSYTRPSGGGVVTYTVSVSSAENGTVTANAKSAGKGSTVTITATPDKGYLLDTLAVTGQNGAKLELTDKGGGKYTFLMPGGKVTVEASFVKAGETPAMQFTDVSAGAYYADAVAWAVEKGVTTGTSATTFSPDASCTRAQTVTFLWRAAGSPAPKSGGNPFSDLSPDAYYYQAVLWAVQQGVTTGTSATTFSPDATVTRDQAVTFLYRAAGSPAAGTDNPFTDVASDAYYAPAVRWAVAEGITTGTSATAFSPEAICTRGQIVTFLYRAAT